MIVYYLDSSAWLKLYFQEQGSEQVRQLFSTTGLLACSTLGIVEVHATIARKHKNADFDTEKFDTLVSEVDLDWQEFARIRFDDEVLRRTLNVTRLFALRGADAVHLASALALHESLIEPEDVFNFVTSDQELKEAVRKAGLQALDPIEQGM